MDVTASFKGVVPGDYFDESHTAGAFVLDNKFLCNTQPWDGKVFPVRIRTERLDSGETITGLSPGSVIDTAHYMGGLVVNGFDIHWLDCEKVSFSYATFNRVGDPQVGYVNDSGQIAHEAFGLKPTPFGERRSFSFEPAKGSKVRRVIFVGEGAIFDEITLHGVSRTSLLALRLDHAPAWLKHRV